MALQRPVIYSDLIAIRKEIDIKEFGYLVNPKDAKKIVQLIQNYQENKTLYLSHCANARNSFESNYNWSAIETKFIDFIENFN